MYDVCIIGAGPAGATAARLLPRNLRVLLVDKRPLDRAYASGDPQKLCGGLLSPRAQAELARQGLGVPQSVLAGPQLFAVRTCDIDAGLERLYQRFYTNIDREAFDRWLVSLVPDSVEVAHGWRALSLERDDEASIVRFATPGGGRASVAARVVIGADGAGSLVRRALLGDTRRVPAYVAMQARCVTAGGEPHYGAIFDAAATDFYGWTIPKGAEVLVGAALPAGPDAHRRFDEFVARAREAGFDFGLEYERAAAPVVRPARPSHITLGRRDVLLAGEAAGHISPSSAEGISYALRSGAAVASALAHGVEGAAERYSIAAWPLTSEVCAKLAKSSLIASATTRRVALRTGIGALRTPVTEPTTTYGARSGGLQAW